MINSLYFSSFFRQCFDICSYSAREAYEQPTDDRSDINLSIRHNFMIRNAYEASYSHQTSQDNDSNIDDPIQGGQYHQIIIDDGECSESKESNSSTNKHRSKILSFFNRFKSHKYSNSNDSPVTQRSRTKETISPLELQEDEVKCSANLDQDKKNAKKIAKLHGYDVSVIERDSSSQSTKPFLFEALTFHCNSKNENHEIPAIPNKSFIMPGSDLQRKMAQAVLSNIEKNKNIHSVDHGEDECVICLDPFSYENPRMPTICGCGQNKTYFHLPCLYQWIEKDRNCPTCRDTLRWEEY